MDNIPDSSIVESKKVGILILREIRSWEKNMENFVENANIDDWRKVWLMYPKVLNLKANKMKPDKKKELLKLDSW